MKVPDNEICEHCLHYRRDKRKNRGQFGHCLKVWPPYRRGWGRGDAEACENWRPRNKRQLAKEALDNLPLFQKPIEGTPLFGGDEQ